MHARRLIVAALLLAGLLVVTLEQSYVHTDDGCAIEMHCHACLLQLGTTGVVSVAFALPPVLLAVERPAAPPAQRQSDTAPRAVASRGPPPA